MTDMSIRDCIPEYIERQGIGLAQSTKDRKQRQLEGLCDYLEGEGVHGTAQLTVVRVHGYLEHRAGYASQTKSGIMFTVRSFLDWLHDNGRIGFTGRSAYPVIRINKREKPVSFYGVDEIGLLIASVDVEAEAGRRDRCIIVLISETGLRRSDVANLRRSNIDFENNMLSGIQVKTGLPYSLPMSEGLRLHLGDYLMNHRPGGPGEPDDHVFLNVRNAKPCSPSSISGIVPRNFEKAGIDTEGKKHGPHALRSSIATGMQERETPLNVISAVLGHSGSSSAIAYLSTDIPALRRLALEVPSL